MATGIQTGMQRGSRSGISRGSALGKGAPGGGGGPLGKVTEIWKGLGKGVKVTIVGLIAVLAFGGIGIGIYSKKNTYVELYPTKMTQNDVSEVSAALTELKVDHEVNITNDGILLHPSKKIAMQGALASRNLPRTPVLTPDKVEGGLGKTAAEQKMMRQQLLEGEITLAFRAMDGVNDARVKLAVPDRTYFQDDKKHTTARVLLSLKPELQVNRERIKGMVNLVAASVPELRPEDVTILDTAGRDLTAMVPKDDTGSLVASGTQLETQANEEMRLQKKAQEALDAAMPGRTKVSVNLDMDFSKVEREHFTPGGAGDDGVVRSSHQIKREVLDRSGNKGGDEVATQVNTSSGKKDGDYLHEVESANYMIEQVKEKRVDTGFRIKRLTASVLADNVSEKEVAAISGFVQDAIGIDPARGDKISVNSFPFDRALDPNANAELPPLVLPTEQSQGVPTGALVGVAVAGAAMMLAVLGMFLFKQHGVRGDQGSIISSPVGGMSGATLSGHTDHFTAKDGKITAPANSAGATQVNTTDQLEQLVKERPTKVAEMLKSTWLS